MRKPSFKKTREAIENGSFASWPKKTQEGALLTPNKNGHIALHVAASTGHLSQIPKDLLTERNLLIADKNGSTSLHFAAVDGHFDQIPKDILTQENLLIPDKDQETPTHWAARWCRLEKIPIRLPLSTLKTLSKWEYCPEKSQTWIKKEIQRAIIREALQNCRHPDL